MLPEITHKGRVYHNLTVTMTGVCVEDWITGERVWIDQATMREDLDFRVGWDYRYFYTQNRERLDMKPGYVAIGADKWEWPDFKDYGWTNPPPPLDTVT